MLAPGDFIAELPVNAFIHAAGLPINTFRIEVLRGPVEFTRYTSGRFRSAFAGHGMCPSVGRTGSCFDNMVAESFFATLRTEIGTTVRVTRNDARRDVFAYIGYYTPKVYIGHSPAFRRATGPLHLVDLALDNPACQIVDLDLVPRLEGLEVGLRHLRSGEPGIGGRRARHGVETVVGALDSMSYNGSRTC